MSLQGYSPVEYRSSQCSGGNSGDATRLLHSVLERSAALARVRVKSRNLSILPLLLRLSAVGSSPTKFARMVPHLVMATPARQVEKKHAHHIIIL